MARAALAAVLAIAALITASCGGGDRTAARRDLGPPPLTVPRPTPPPSQTSTATEPPTTTSTPPSTTPTQPSTTPTEPSTTTGPAPASHPSAPSGGQQAPSGNTRQDSPGHDVPPPSGSPAERFERFCRENPGACG